MTEKVKKYLSDILKAIDLIEDFNKESETFSSYEDDLKSQSATERQLAIIGEALNKLRKIEPDVYIENDKQIIGFRNRLIHAYDSIDNSIVWMIIKKHLPMLKAEIKRMDQS